MVMGTFSLFASCLLSSWRLFSSWLLACSHLLDTAAVPSFLPFSRLCYVLYKHEEKGGGGRGGPTALSHECRPSSLHEDKQESHSPPPPRLGLIDTYASTLHERYFIWL